MRGHKFTYLLQTFLKEKGKFMVIQMETRIKGQTIMALSHIHIVNKMMVYDIVYLMLHFFVRIAV